MTTDSNQVCIQFWWNRKVAKAVGKYILGRGEKSNEIGPGPESISQGHTIL
jgi:hypothetical protein